MRSFYFAALIAWCATCLSAEETKTWAFQPGRDAFSAAALLDLSALNEQVAGKTGFIRRSEDGAGFVMGDGEPIRFWAVNTSVARQGMPALREHARFLAKRGVNMVRLHGQIPQAGKKGGPLNAINTDERSRLWQLVSAMKEEGVYVTFSPYYPHAVRKEAARRWTVPTDSAGLTGMIYFDPVLQDAYKGWLRETLVPVNPYTGVALKDDPALAIFQMQNEDSLLFWSLNGISGREARLLAERFGAFLEEKYGSLDQARGAWGRADAPGPIDDIEDDWERGIIALSNLWHLTGAATVDGTETRLRDQTEFLTTTMRDWHAEVARFLREDIGAKQLFNAGNWRTADNVLMDDLERYAYTSGDIIGVNRYVSDLHSGQYRGWAIVAGDRFREQGVLHRPLDLPVVLRQPAGYPYIIPETLWVPPIWQQSEGPVLMAAYQALTGIDISYWFGANEVQWRAPKSANGYLPSVGKWVTSTPQVMGAFPAAALIFRLGLIDEAAPVVVEHRTLDALWSRETPLTASRQGQDPNRDGLLGSLKSVMGLDQPRRPSASPYSFLVGPVHTVFGSDEQSYIHPELDELVDSGGRVVTSVTRQLEWDWAKGTVTLNAPHVQGAVGALSSRRIFDLQDVEIKSDAPYASVLVVSMDGKPIACSKSLLLQIGSIARPSDWRAKVVQHEDELALEVVSFGAAPWQISEVDAQITLQNPHVSRATSLDANGMALSEVPLSQDEGTVSIRTPKDTLYVILR